MRLIQSLPMRERGLKLHSEALQDGGVESLPMRERGLKHVDGYVERDVEDSRSPCGSVD